MIEYAMDINYMKKNISIQFISDVLTQPMEPHWSTKGMFS